MSPQTQSPLDRKTLAVATIASVLGAMVTSAVGTGFLASLIAAAVVPAVTAFLIHPGPHRRRRFGAVLALVMLLRGGREAMAKPRRTSAPAKGGRPALAASLAFVIAAVTLTLAELIGGSAALADRQFTLLPDDSATHVALAREEAPAPPTLSVPEHRVVRKARTAAGVRVAFPVTAVDAHGDRLTPRCRPASGSRFPVGDTVVRCAVTDRHGLEARARFTVRVVAGQVRGAEAARRPATPQHPDPTPTENPPADEATARPADPAPPRDHSAPRLTLPERVERTGDRSGAIVEYAAHAVDAHDGRVAVECEPPSGSRFRPGRTTVRCTATDRAGNVARGHFVVLVRADTKAPRLDLPRDIEVDAPGAVEYTATATDDRDGRTPVGCSPPSGSHFEAGRTVVRCTATDRAGNTARGRFAVVVQPAPVPDRVPPALSLPPDLTTTAGTPVQFAASALDDRDGAVPVTCTPASGATLPLGRTIVRCSATDRAGNVADGSFVVTVTEPPDTEPPVLELPDDITEITSDSEGAVVRYVARAVDGRDGRVPIDCDPPSGSTFPFEVTTVTCTASDRAGNVATDTFTVTVTD